MAHCTVAGIHGFEVAQMRIPGGAAGFSGIWPVRPTQSRDYSLALCARQQQPALKEKASTTKTSPPKRVRARRRTRSSLQKSDYGSVTLPPKILVELRRLLKRM